MEARALPPTAPSNPACCCCCCTPRPRSWTVGSPRVQLMKRLRGAKSATVGTKDEKKKVLGALDSDIHKLLGTEYKRYRTVQHSQHEMHTALKKGTPPASTLASPPPPAVAVGKKKKSGLPGAMSKKKASSTTVG
jgi:hypothetical protein